MEQNKFDLEEFIIKNHDPNNQYYLIKQNIKNLENEVYEFDEFINKDNFKKFQKIDIFRGAVQYLEEFLLYFFAKFEDVEYHVALSRTDNRDIIEKVNALLEIENLSQSLIEKFDLNGDNVSDFIEVFKNIVSFFTMHKDVYNSIKHGFRVFPYDFDYFELGNDEVTYERLDIDDEYVEFICKHEETIYTLGYPIDCLVEDSEVVLDQIHEIFNYIMGKSNYENSENFKYSPTKEFNKYIKLRNGEATLFFKHNEWFKKYLSNDKLYFYSELIKERNKIKMQLSTVPEYPFLVMLETKQELTTSPELFNVEKIKIIEFDKRGDIEQIKLLKEIQESINDEEFKFHLKFNNIEYECKNIDLGYYSDYEFEENIIDIIIRLKQILGINVAFPFSLSETQYNLLNNHNGRFNRRADAEKFVDELKKTNRTIVNVFLDVVNEDGKNLYKRILGSTPDLKILNFYKLDKLEDEKHVYGREVEDPTGNVIANLSRMQNNLIEGNDLSDLEGFSFDSKINVKIGYIKKLWINEYNMFFTIKLKE